jgi:peptidoglycan/xylan/chitin deacetylase (PgdA/CDA1 family)
MDMKILKTLILAGIFIAIAGVLTVVYPDIRNNLYFMENGYIKYSPGNLSKAPGVENLPPAKGVPILMYHGITKKPDAENTDLPHFIKQMEMLKKEGYATISLKNLDDFMHGNFILPPKPIIITFDDGRKDSFYPADDIFKKLGFKAAIFIASAKQENKDRFFLSWDELEMMKESGRWEIEAHGKNSHDKIRMNVGGDEGRYLTSFIYFPDRGLESQAEFQKRVEADYSENVDDLKKNLNIIPKYYAIPLNDYGQIPQSNNKDSIYFNREMTKKYFKMAFIETIVWDGNVLPKEDVYNYKNDDPYQLRRIEVKNMEDSELIKILTLNQLSLPKLSWEKGKNYDALMEEVSRKFGKSSIDGEGLHITTDSDFPSAMISFGDSHWFDYTLEADVRRVRGRSISIAGYIKDNSNYVLTGITDNGIFLREFIDGKETDLAPSIILQEGKDASNNFKLIFNQQEVSVYLNNKLMYDRIKISSDRGNFGFKAWDDKNGGEALVSSLNIFPSDKK